MPSEGPATHADRMTSAGEHEAALGAACAAIEAHVHPAAILLFGSRAGGRARADSDYDIAVLCAQGAAPEMSAWLALRDDLEERMGGSVDLVLLDTASPILAMQVLRHGRRLACARPEELEAFTVRTLTDYADLKITRRPIEERLLPSRGA